MTRLKAFRGNCFAVIAVSLYQFAAGPGLRPAGTAIRGSAGSKWHNGWVRPGRAGFCDDAGYAQRARS